MNWLAWGAQLLSLFGGRKRPNGRSRDLTITPAKLKDFGPARVSRPVATEEVTVDFEPSEGSTPAPASTTSPPVYISKTHGDPINL